MQEYVKSLAEYSKGIEWYMAQAKNNSVTDEDTMEVKHVYNNRSLVCPRECMHQLSLEV